MLAVAFGGPAKAAECDEVGVASYYCCEHHGRLTASGEPFDQYALTAAMPDRRMMGSTVRVCLVDDPGRCVVVRVNDFGPHPRLNRVIDLSLAAFEAIAPRSVGVVEVCISY